MGIISVSGADRLYWLGRYVERVYTTLRLYVKSFDALIDGVDADYKKFCAALDIPDAYGSKEEFLKCYPFDAVNPDSLISNLNRAYDNAIVLRETIGSEALSYVQLSVYDLNGAAGSASPLIGMQYLLDHILAFWGAIDDTIDCEQTRNIIKAGMRVERVDLYARLNMPPEELYREVRRMMPRVIRSGLPFNPVRMDLLIGAAGQNNPDYDVIVFNIEALIGETGQRCAAI